MINAKTKSLSAGFTLVELLIIIAILGILIGLLLPTVQAAREQARRATCASNLRQTTTALLLYHEQRGRFPYGGWGHEWVGVPDRGSGRDQPGGWIYVVLPFVEHQALHDLGDAGTPQDLSHRLATPLSLFNCPARRPCQAWPVAARYAYIRTPRPAGNVEAVARGDYAINAGASAVMSFPGPPSLDVGDSSTFDWPSPTGYAPSPLTAFTGISHLRQACSMRQITDGASETYLVGEKYLDADHYFDGQDLGDNESLYSGYCTDNHRFTSLHLAPSRDASSALTPTDYMRFGSAHPSGAFMAYCDGSVRLIGYGIDPLVHYMAGHRDDQGGKPPQIPGVLH